MKLTRYLVVAVLSNGVSRHFVAYAPNPSGAAEATHAHLRGFERLSGYSLLAPEEAGTLDGESYQVVDDPTEPPRNLVERWEKGFVV